VSTMKEEFSFWLSDRATDEERAMPYEWQAVAYIQWQMAEDKKQRWLDGVPEWNDKEMGTEDET